MRSFWFSLGCHLAVLADHVLRTVERSRDVMMVLFCFEFFSMDYGYDGFSN